MRNRGRPLLAAALLALMAACAHPPGPQPQPQPPAEPALAAMPEADCGELRFEQWGRMLRSDGRSVTVDRGPFVIHYTGPARDALWLHAAGAGNVVAGLDPVRDRELWLPAGLGMATARDDSLWLASESQLALGPQARRLATLPFTVVRTRDAATGRLALRVNAIQGRAVAQSRVRRLHLVALRVLETPADAGSPYRAAWSACTVLFRGG